jgi:hypothetical protein
MTLEDLAKMIEALPVGAASVAISGKATIRTNTLEGNVIESSLVGAVDLKALVADWRRRGEALGEAIRQMVRICAVDGLYGKQIAMAFVETHHKALKPEEGE